MPSARRMKAHPQVTGSVRAQPSSRCQGSVSPRQVGCLAAVATVITRTKLGCLEFVRLTTGVDQFSLATGGLGPRQDPAAEWVVRAWLWSFWCPSAFGGGLFICEYPQSQVAALDFFCPAFVLRASAGLVSPFQLDEARQHFGVDMQNRAPGAGLSELVVLSIVSWSPWKVIGARWPVRRRRGSARCCGRPGRSVRPAGRRVSGGPGLRRGAGCGLHCRNTAGVCRSGR